MDSAYMKYASLKKDNEKKEVFSTPFLFVLFTSVLISIALLLLHNSVSSFMEIPQGQSVITTYIIFILLFDALSVIPFAYLRLARKAKKFAAIRTASILLNVTLNVILIRFFNFGVKAVFISNVVSSLFTFLVLLPDIVKNLQLQINKETLKAMLKFGIPYLPAGIASMVIQVIDRPILQALTNQNLVGIYGANYKLGIFMMLFVSMFQYAWQPFFLNNAKEANAKEIFAKVLTYFVLAGSLILVFISSYLDIIKLLIGRGYWSGLPIIPIILLGYLFNGIYINFTAGIFIKEKTKHLPYITGIGALTNVVVNFLLIPVWGMIGAALATLASYFIMAIVLFFITQRFYKIDYEYSKILRIFFAIGIYALGFYSLGGANLLYKTGLLILFFMLLFILRIINKEEILSLKNLLFKKLIRIPGKRL
jgi:O-antigen/teichoic acid export membrane protein